MKNILPELLVDFLTCLFWFSFGLVGDIYTTLCMNIFISWYYY